jgi:hypothetical protein
MREQTATPAQLITRQEAKQIPRGSRRPSFRIPLPFLSGLSAETTTFSKDGQWIAYVTYPQGALWTQENCANSHPWIMELPGRYQTESETADSKGGLQDGGSPVARRELAQGNLRATGHASWMLYQVDVNRPQHRPGYEVRYGYFGQGRQERL